MDGTDYLRHAIAHFEAIRRKAERALAQVGDDRFFERIDPRSNSLATLVKHLAGNLRSRWTDFLTTDGEKPGRRRDGEFEHERPDTRASLAAAWDEGWSALFQALGDLVPADLDRIVTIRGDRLTAYEAIERQKEHYACHVGQMVFLAKHLAGPAWTTLSIPRGGTAAFEAERRAEREAPPGG